MIPSAFNYCLGTVYNLSTLESRLITAARKTTSETTPRIAAGM